ARQLLNGVTDLLEGGDLTVTHGEDPVPDTHARIPGRSGADTVRQGCGINLAVGYTLHGPHRGREIGVRIRDAGGDRDAVEHDEPDEDVHHHTAGEHDD